MSTHTHTHIYIYIYIYIYTCAQIRAWWCMCLFTETVCLLCFLLFFGMGWRLWGKTFFPTVCVCTLFFLFIICLYGASCFRSGYEQCAIEMSILTYLHLSWSRMTWLMEEEILLMAHAAHVVTCFLMLGWQTSPSSRKQTFTIQSCTFGPAWSRYYIYKISLACFMYVSHLTFPGTLFCAHSAITVLVDWALKNSKSYNCYLKGLSEKNYLYQLRHPIAFLFKGSRT